MLIWLKTNCLPKFWAALLTHFASLLSSLLANYVFCTVKKKSCLSSDDARLVVTEFLVQVPSFQCQKDAITTLKTQRFVHHVPFFPSTNLQKYRHTPWKDNTFGMPSFEFHIIYTSNFSKILPRSSAITMCTCCVHDMYLMCTSVLYFFFSINNAGNK